MQSLPPESIISTGSLFHRVIRLLKFLMGNLKEGVCRGVVQVVGAGGGEAEMKGNQSMKLCSLWISMHILILVFFQNNRLSFFRERRSRLALWR